MIEIQFFEPLSPKQNGLIGEKLSKNSILRRKQIKEEEDYKVKNIFIGSKTGEKEKKGA